MSRTRDNPDPSLILNTTRDHVSSSKITDPANDEPLDVAHQAQARIDGEIWRVLNKVKGQDTGANKVLSTFVRRMDILFGSGARDADGRMTRLERGSSGSHSSFSTYAALIGVPTAFLFWAQRQPN
ncbi:hypothetical protein B0H10DRAFT_1959381 [Mycena sp. CBHHK59/15]|nr:hypothetical protein B0H10DRAFT_1959381 [Mycena sp. CBHHK59/15]